MLQNSLGRYWMEAHPEHTDLTSKWQLYIEHQQEDFAEKIAPYVNKELNVEEIKCFDPAMGSGHILVYMFDVLFEIYSKCGYMERDIPRLILENNLYGLDIDDRAYQLACFSVVMKALEYNKRLLRSIERDGLQLKLASIQETNNLSIEDIQYLAGENEGKTLDKVFEFIKQFKHAKTIGSLLKVDSSEINTIKVRLNEVKSKPVENWLDDQNREKVIQLVPSLIKQADIMGQKYDIIVTNPPYMRSRGMNKELSSYLRQKYFDSKADLFAAFMEIDHFIKKGGFYAAINQHSWMFLSTYEKLRSKILTKYSLDTLMHLGSRAFEEIGGEVVQTCSFVLRNSYIDNAFGKYYRLTEFNTPEDKKGNALIAIKNGKKGILYSSNQSDFLKIPGLPIAYWLSENIYGIFDTYASLGDKVKIKSGLQTSDNKRFLRYWHEVSYNRIGFRVHSNESAKLSGFKWFHYNKGGSYCKWYGNNDYVVNWKNDGKEIKDYSRYINTIKDSTMGVAPNSEFYFEKHISWSLIASKSFSCRFYETGVIFDISAPSIFSDDQSQLLIYLALLNSKLADFFVGILNPTINFSSGVMKKLPAVEVDDNNDKQRMINLSKDNIDIAQTNWNMYELSWDYKKHPLLKYSSNTIELSFKDRKSTRLNSSHVAISYAVFCLKKKKQTENPLPEPRQTEFTTHGRRTLTPSSGEGRQCIFAGGSCHRKRAM